MLPRKTLSAHDDTSNTTFASWTSPWRIPLSFKALRTFRASAAQAFTKGKRCTRGSINHRSLEPKPGLREKSRLTHSNLCQAKPSLTRPRLPHATRGPSCGHVDGVEANAIDATPSSSSSSSSFKTLSHGPHVERRTSKSIHNNSADARRAAGPRSSSHSRCGAVLRRQGLAVALPLKGLFAWPRPDL